MRAYFLSASDVRILNLTIQLWTTLDIILYYSLQSKIIILNVFKFKSFYYLYRKISWNCGFNTIFACINCCDSKYLKSTAYYNYTDISDI